MLSSKILTASCLVSVASALAACGQPQTSTVKTRMDVPTDLVAQSDLTAFAAQARQIKASATHGGSIPASALVALLPMQADQRQIIENAFPDPLSVSCPAGGLCTASAQGQGATATMNVTISGFINNPDLVLSPNVSFQFLVRAPDAVEFCNASGMKVSALFMTEPVTGMYERVEDGALKLTVNVNNDSQNYTCQ